MLENRPLISGESVFYLLVINIIFSFYYREKLENVELLGKMLTYTFFGERYCKFNKAAGGNMREGSLEKIDISSPIVDKVRGTIKHTHLNGGIILECFQIHNREWLKFPVKVEKCEPYFSKILTSDDVRLAVPELKIGEKLDCDPEFQWLSPFCLDGAIAAAIHSGGAYVSFPGPPGEAKRMALDLCSFMFGDRYQDVKVYESYKPWCKWFFDVAWEYTWFILDTALERIWLICITDTD